VRLARAWQIGDHMASCVNLSVTRYTPPRRRRIAFWGMSRTVFGRRNERGRVRYDSAQTGLVREHSVAQRARNAGFGPYRFASHIHLLIRRHWGHVHPGRSGTGGVIRFTRKSDSQPRAFRFAEVKRPLERLLVHRAAEIHSIRQIGLRARVIRLIASWRATR
jgi:hypothetical protein